MIKEILMLILTISLITSLTQFEMNNTISTASYENSGNPLEWLREKIDNIFNSATEISTYVLVKIYDTIIIIARILYMVLGLYGFVLWFSGYSPYRGRRILMGAAALAIVIELINNFNIHP